MPAAATALSAAGTTPAADLGLVEPQLRELMALAAQARLLPGWRRSIRARQSGNYLSALRGRGMEYDESRPYQPGDDIRQLDWRVTARTGRAHTKLFREERERPVFVCVDYRRAMFFATRGVFKAVQAARLASLLAWRAQLEGDRVGGLLFADAEHHELPPRRGRTAALQWVKLLVSEAPRCRTTSTREEAALGDALERLRRLAKPGSLAFLISDFRGLDDDATARLVRLAAHIDVGLIVVHDPLEARFPAMAGDAMLTDGGRRVRLAGITDAARDDYAARFTARLERVQQIGRERRLPCAVVDTTADPVGALARMLGASR